jgi:hypothetical protein
MADELQLQTNAPERYVVVKGDTIWGIAGKFLKDPWKWPKVWKMNRAQIKNPHWIYPGDVVVLDTSRGSPELRLLHETVTLQPGIRVEPLQEEAIPSIAPNIIAPFLTQPLVIENGGLDDSPVIIAGPENRVAFSPGAKVYTSKIDEDAGLIWNIYRPGKALIDPDTNELLGTEALYLGDAKIEKFGEPASARILRAKEEIFTQDKLVVAPDTLQAAFVPHAPEADIKGRIITIYGGVAEAGANTVIAINKGSRDGLEEGHVLSISRAGRYISRDPTEKKVGEKYPITEAKFPQTTFGEESSKKDKPKAETVKPVAKYDPEKDPANDKKLIKLPDERIGLMMIFRTFDRVSYGLIMQTSEPVNVLDIVQTP